MNVFVAGRLPLRVELAEKTVRLRHLRPPRLEEAGIRIVHILDENERRERMLRPQGLHEWIDAFLHLRNVEVWQAVEHERRRIEFGNQLRQLGLGLAVAAETEIHR